MNPIACLGTLMIAAFATVGEGEEKDRVFVGYLYGQPRALDYRLYTHLCHAFLVADGDGKIRPGGNVPNRGLTEEAHKAGVKVLISLGGWGWDKQFGEMVKSHDAEDRYVADVLKMVEEFGYDGLDLDWEYPDTAEEVEGFERLVRRFRAGLDEQGRKRDQPMRLTMAASANPGTLKWLATPFLVETMDWVNVMTYDMAGDWTPYAGHHAPLHASSRVAGGG
ncbi:MAG: glycosyl hydrolase family 18 protein, partial [Isosphaeraceae bacterium]